jgi:hypothetical protein
MERISRPYGASSETESSWPDDALSEAHSRYISIIHGTRAGTPAGGFDCVSCGSSSRQY